ncbi:N-Acyltransferase family protein [Rhizobium etli bv. phaseoli str. IE4803]|uniref:N-Acyltransferase family protein n=1 Tax=Rhizobium etli bv. mimosae str. IE4771 TaxID=1432050 RepID=A0A060I927_RHIET|nr:GNAT family N-acetyltransferase [Rhizobium sp. IE4771]AIC28081.1 N-Acyltransferase family protein [Rhizobium sp. IE4771]AJC80140.1 N-Acyltransferase family protein [Rhizobium etli bv. phaseoli str. IE4803]
MRHEIVEARVEDAPDCVRVLRQSIAELCWADHHGDAAAIGEWLENKTAENVSMWIQNPRTIFFIGKVAGLISGVGSALVSGEITLLYVDPAVRYQGLSTALLEALEERLRCIGSSKSFLSSTETARAFYVSRGYIVAENGNPPKMEKTLICSGSK